MSQLFLFYRLILRPLFREPVRSSLTVLAIALGVAVVLAIDLAGTAAAGSFRSSIETLAGENDLEIVTAGGVPGKCSRHAGVLCPLRCVSHADEDYAVVARDQANAPTNRPGSCLRKLIAQQLLSASLALTTPGNLGCERRYTGSVRA